MFYVLGEVSYDYGGVFEPSEKLIRVSDITMIDDQGDFRIIYRDELLPIWTETPFIELMKRVEKLQK